MMPATAGGQELPLLRIWHPFQVEELGCNALFLPELGYGLFSC